MKRASLAAMVCFGWVGVVGAANPVLMGWWRFDEGTGGTAIDYSVRGNYGYLMGNPTWAAGHNGGGLSFDGVDDYVTCGNYLDITNEVTISAWIKLDSTDRDQKIAGNQGNTGGGYKFGVVGNLLEFEIRTASGMAVLNRASPGGTPLQPGVWYHVAGMYSASGQYIRTYVNGQLDRELITQEVLGSSTGTFEIGHEPYANLFFWYGSIDDVRVYQGAMTTAEVAAVGSAGYSGGVGTAADPYQINSADNWMTLTWTEADWTKCFILTADIDLAGKTPRPVGFSIYGGSTPFYGVMDGNGHVIRNLTMKSWSFDTHGLFGYIASAATIKNLGVVNVDIQGGYSTGALVGINNKGTITACYASGSVAGTGGQIGGLVGSNYGTISSCHSTALVTGAADAVGGIVGINWGKLTTCYATGAVSGVNQVGGLIGANYNSDIGGVRQCYSVGPVSGTGADVGGLVGAKYNSGTVEASFWDKETSGWTTSAGGTGKTTDEMKTQSTFTAAGWDFLTTDGDPADWIMIMAGIAYPKLPWQIFYSAGRGTEVDPYQISTVEDWQWLTVASGHWDRHFVLMADIEMAGVPSTPIGNPSTSFTGVFDGRNHVIRDVLIRDVNYAGIFGIIGSGGQIRYLGADNVTLNGTTNIGGLCGVNDGTLIGCYAIGSVIGGNDSSFLGGLCGVNRGNIHGCYATGSVTARIDSGMIGGLCGTNGGTITHSYAKCAVKVDGTDTTPFHGPCGGLCGANGGTISNSYATGGVVGYKYCIVGGLCGWNMKGTISDCYAIGNVIGGILYGHGGLCGANDNSGTIEGCFWDLVTSGQDTSDGGTGKTTLEMKRQSTFAVAGWDFTGVWEITDNQSYPHLRVFQRQATPSADLNGDGRVDLADFALFAEQWMK